MRAIKLGLPGNVLLYSLIYLILFTAVLSAGTTGKLAGSVTDKKTGEPLPGVNVVLEGTILGASTDMDGFYYIINIPPGTYSVSFEYLGYKTRIVKNVKISADKTTRLDAELEETVLQGENVVVVAQRPVIEVNVTSSVSTLGKDEIEVMPVFNLSEIVDLQAGVVDGHFRGGRLGEVQYQVNGVSVNNLYDNNISLELDRSLIQEVQVISGTFDAEYGQAMSGVVNAILKSGSQHFEWKVESFLSDYMYTSGRRRNMPDKFRPLSIQNYQMSLSGPLLIPHTTFIANVRESMDNGYIYGKRIFLPTDSADFEHKIFHPSGDGKEVPLETRKEFSGLFKVTNTSFGRLKLEYQLIYNKIQAKRYNFAFRINPDGAAHQTTTSLVHGLDLTYTFSANTFMTFNLRQNFFDYGDYKYKDVYDPRYDEAGPPLGDPNYELGAYVQGVELNRFVQTTKSYIVKGTITSQVNKTHLVKAGGEFQYSNLEFGVPGYIIANGLLLSRHVNEPPDYPGIQVYHPINAVGFVQDQIEWNDFILRAGVRWEYFDARSTVPSDLHNPANTIQGAPRSYPKPTTPKSTVAPRLGVSFPLTSSAALYFAYGHFYQMPPLGQVFSNANYEVLKDLQAGGISYGVLGNPDIKPEKTVQYEFGYKYAITSNIGLDVSMFFKDIRDLLGVEFVSTYAAAEYARLTNVDFGNVLGVTISFNQRNFGPISTFIDYTWQRAMGNSSDPRETAIRAAAGQDPRPRLIPLNWDQRHTLNVTMIIEKPGDYSISPIIRFGSGQPYTPSIKAGFGGALETNSGRKKSYFRIDLRAQKYFSFKLFKLSAYVRILNLLDTRFANGFVFSDTGSPDYTLDPVGQRVTLADPHRYFPPRRVEVGITISSKVH